MRGSRWAQKISQKEVQVDWENENWVKLYTRESHDMLAVGWEGRALFRELICKVDRAGVLDCTDPVVISELVRMPIEIVEPALSKLIARGTVTICDQHLVVPNFLEAQEAKSNDRERKRKSRETKRAKALRGQLVTNRDERSRNGSQNVTDCPDDCEPPDKKSRLEKSRVEEREEMDGRARSPDAYRALVAELWQLQQDLRIEAGARSLGPLPPADVGREIIDRIREQAGPDHDLELARSACRQFLDAAAAEVRGDPAKVAYLDGRMWTGQRFCSTLSRGESGGRQRPAPLGSWEGERDGGAL